MTLTPSVRAISLCNFSCIAWQSVRILKITELDGGIASNQRLLERLEAENAQLRGSVVELVLQIQVLRDDALSAWSAIQSICD